MLRELRKLLCSLNTGVLLGEMCLDRPKNHGCGQKKPEGISSARFGLRTIANAVNPSVVPTEFAAEHEVLEGRFVT